MRSRWFIGFVLLLTVVNLAAVATFAYQRFFHHRCTPACPAEKIGTDGALKQRLGLDEEGYIRLQNLRQKHQQRTQPIVAELAEKRLRLTQAVMSAEPDSLEVLHICGQIDSLQSRMQHSVVQHLMEQKEILTSAQQEKLYTLMMNCCAVNRKNSNKCSIQHQ